MKQRIDLSKNASDRRNFMLTGASLALPQWADAAVNKRDRPMTAAEESAAAMAMAKAFANETGGMVHNAIGTSPRLRTELTLFDGTAYSEGRARGKLLFLFYWASWCPICKVVTPRLNEFWKKNQAKGVEVLALSVDAEMRPALAYMQHNGYKFPAGMARDAKLPSSMTPGILPTLMVRSRLGVILNVEHGELDDDEITDFLVHL
jgi:thiol-disulfide isomerase/thioredoxin